MSECRDRHSLLLSCFGCLARCALLLILTTSLSKPLYVGTIFLEFSITSELLCKGSPIWVLISQNRLHRLPLFGKTKGRKHGTSVYCVSRRDGPRARFQRWQLSLPAMHATYSRAQSVVLILVIAVHRFQPSVTKGMLSRWV